MTEGEAPRNDRGGSSSEYLMDAAQRGLRRDIGLFRVREVPAANIPRERPGRLLDCRGEVRIAAHEAGGDPSGQAHDVVEDEDLAVAGSARPDPDRRDG